MSVIDSGIPGVDQIPPGTHFCALYSGSGERDDLLFPFLSKGLRDGDTCVCYIDGLEHGAVRARAVGEAGVADPPPDRFDVRPASEVYLQSGTFSIDHMTSVLSDNVEQVVAEGSGLLRVTGEMPWPGVLLQPHGADDFFVYEAALNDVVDRKPAIFMCMYELQRFGLDMLVAVLKTHPVVLLDRTVLDNPHFLTRAEYDAEVADPTNRRSLGAASAADRGPDAWPSLTPSEPADRRICRQGSDQQGHRPPPVRVTAHSRCASEAHVHEGSVSTPASRRPCSPCSTGHHPPDRRSLTRPVALDPGLRALGEPCSGLGTPQRDQGLRPSGA